MLAFGSGGGVGGWGGFEGGGAGEGWREEDRNTQRLPLFHDAIS